MSVVIGHDAIHANVSRLPAKGQTAGYTTGSPDIKWTPADWALHGHAVRICQDAAASDHTADVLDVERGAATNGECAGWYRAALKAFQSAARPGQRAPAIYTSASNVTPLVNTLIADGVRSGPNLWVARWDNAVAADQQAVENASGPFPVIGFQYASGRFYDSNVFSAAWLAAVSRKAATVPHRHLTRAGDTAATIAATRNMKPGAWLDLQDKLGADAHTLASGPLPAGLTWLSVNP